MIKKTKKKRAPYNRTMEVSKKECTLLLKKTIKLTSPVTVKNISNKIINQDLFEVLNFLPKNFIDLLFIDPPYNISKKYNRSEFKEMDEQAYKVWFNSWFVKLIPSLKSNASVYICCDWKSSSAIVDVVSNYLITRNRITWEREKGRGAKNNWKNCSEDIWFFTKSNKYTFNVDLVKQRRKVIAPYKDENGNPKDWIESGKISYRDTYPSNIWSDISIPFWSMAENTDHPTQKPEKLLAKIILASSNKGDLVFDPFLGSGTTASVAVKLDRKFSGVEIDEYYCCLSQKRVSKAKSDRNIQGFYNGVFWERNTLRDRIKNNLKK